MDGIGDDYLRYVFHVQVITEPAPEPNLNQASYIAADDPVQGDAALAAAFAAATPAEIDTAFSTSRSYSFQSRGSRIEISSLSVNAKTPPSATRSASAVLTMNSLNR